MPVDAIGSPSSAAAQTNANSSIDQQEFLRLFLTTLRYQDPTEPASNTDFLAQLAQFANLEQVRQTNESLQTLVFNSATAQAVSLLGRSVGIAGSNGEVVGIVKAIQFTSAGPRLTVDTGTPNNPNFVTDVRLSEITLAR